MAVLGGALARATGRPGRAARDDDERRLPPYAVVLRGRRPGGRRQAGGPPGGADAGERPQQPGVAAGAARRATARASSSSTASISRPAASWCSPRPPHANRVLSDRFKAHDLERAYLAVVTGRFPDELARIDKPVNGRPAVTHVAVRERFGTRATLVACRLETGRTHQIRLHVLARGLPGDRRRSLRRPFSRRAGAADGAARDDARLRSPPHGGAAVVHQPLAPRPQRLDRPPPATLDLL